ncbi:MAG: NAD-dependent deacylase [Alphaproteobacteria bacterium BRH_c36]|nr:MAG: NAD-dependent deacylase [Alphaproteobacteria bacterium BRH_c36]
MPRYEKIVILTGAGLSAESGLATFRDSGGIWAQYDYRDVATPDGFQRNPNLVYEFYNMRRREAAKAVPNAAHEALARLQHDYSGEVLLVTQNIDNLLEQAGAQNLIHMHGEMTKMLCTHCDARLPWTEDLSADLACPECELIGGMRPAVVWFGEVPYEMPHIAAALGACDLFIAIGTSGNVYPAASFVAAALEAGAHTVELNLEPSDTAGYFAERLHGPATEIVPAYVDRLLSE